MSPGESPHSDQRQNALLDGCLHLLRVEAKRLAARVAALVELTALSGADAERAGVRRYLELEVAGSLRVGQVTASRWLAEADRYTTALPRTLELLGSGELLVHQASVLLLATSHCPVGIAQQVEQRILTGGPDGMGGAGLCPADLRRLVAHTVLQVESEQADRAAAEQRHADAAAQRRSGGPSPDPSPMGWGWPGRC